VLKIDIAVKATITPGSYVALASGATALGSVTQEQTGRLRYKTWVVLHYRPTEAFLISSASKTKLGIPYAMSKLRQAHRLGQNALSCV